MSKFKSLLHVITLVSIVCLMLNLRGAQAAGSLGAAFTYQGQLKDGSGNPVTNTCDFQFGLYPALTGGSLVAGTTLQTVTGVTVTNGYFTVSLDFGAGAFDGNARWLQIGVSCPSGGSYTTLAPRQPLTAAPYAIYAVNAGTAAGLSGVLPLANGGTGSATKNFVDLTTAQTVGGVKTFSSAPSFTASTPFNVTGSSLVTNLNADRLDGQHASAFQQHYKNVLVVAKSGGDFTTITAALANITDASAANPYLIYVAPGVYTEQVTMKPYVDIEGAGELATRITYLGSQTFITGTVIGADNAELRFLTVENTGAAFYATAIYNFMASPRLTHITASASGGSLENDSVYNINDSSPTMTNVTATASGGSLRNFAVYNDSSSPTMTDGTATASGGANSIGVLNTNSSSPTMTGGSASASGATNNYGVDNEASSAPSMTDVTASASGGTITYGVYNLNSSSTMTGVTATAKGGTHRNYGVYNNASSPSMTNMTASATGVTDANVGVENNASSPVMTNVMVIASGGTDNYGVDNEASAATTMTNVTVIVSGGTNNWGVYNANSSPTMQKVNVIVSGGSYNFGVYNIAASPTMMDVSATASGGTNTAGVYNVTASPTMINVTVIGSEGTFNRGVWNDNSSPTMTGLSATASGGSRSYGVWNDSSSVAIKNSTIIASNGNEINDGIHNTATSGAYTVTIDASQISAASSTIHGDSVYTTTRIGASELIGGAVSGTGNYTCLLSYNGSYTALTSTCFP